MKGTVGAVLFIAAVYALGVWLSICFGVIPAVIGGVIVTAPLLGVGLSSKNRPEAT